MGLFGLSDFVVCDRRKTSVCPRVEGPVTVFLVVFGSSCSKRRCAEMHMHLYTHTHTHTHTHTRPPVHPVDQGRV